MKASLIKGVSGKYSSTYNFNDGLNYFAEPLKIKDNQLSDCNNISNRNNKSSVSVRQGRSVGDINGVTYPNFSAMGRRDSQLHVVYDKKYIIMGSLTNDTIITVNGTGNFCEFNTGTENNIIYSNGTDRIIYNGSTFITLTNAPTGTYKFTVSQGRLYWIKGNKIIFSALQLPNDYTVASGGGEITVSETSTLSAIVSYDNKIIVWGESDMWILYGTDPETFQLVKISGDVGNTHMSGTCVCNDKLYWSDLNFMYYYDGSLPVKMGDEIQKYIQKGKGIYHAGSYGNYLYLTILQDAGSVYNMLVYDTVLNKWYKRNDKFKFYSKSDESLLAISIDDNKMYAVDSYLSNYKDYHTGKDYPGSNGTSPTLIDWFFETKEFNYGEISKPSVLSEIWVRYSLGIGSGNHTMTLQCSLDGGSYETLHVFEDTNGLSRIIRVLLPIDTLGKTIKFKFFGTGYFTIDYMELKYRIKPR